MKYRLLQLTLPKKTNRVLKMCLSCFRITDAEDAHGSIASPKNRPSNPICFIQLQGLNDHLWEHHSMIPRQLIKKSKPKNPHYSRKIEATNININAPTSEAEEQNWIWAGNNESS